jgi:hypothetical protein
MWPANPAQLTTTVTIHREKGRADLSLSARVTPRTKPGRAKSTTGGRLGNDDASERSKGGPGHEGPQARFVGSHQRPRRHERRRQAVAIAAAPEAATVATARRSGPRPNSQAPSTAARTTSAYPDRTPSKVPAKNASLEARRFVVPQSAQARAASASNANGYHRPPRRT